MAWINRLPHADAATARRLWLIVPLALTVAPHLTVLPAWLGLSWAMCAVVSLRLAGGTAPRALRWLKPLLTLAGIAGVLLEFGSVLGTHAGVALLVFLSGVKQLELETARDRYGLLFLGCFLLVAWFLSHQEIGAAAWMTLASVALTAGLLAENKGDAPPAATLGQAALLLVQALPLALLLFVLFPRLQAPLWGLSQDAAASTGLSDHMRPGDIGRLILSDDLALRAEFVGADPSPDKLYWRGPVFWDFDGRTWGNRTPPPPGKPHAAPIGTTTAYILTLEPQRWLLLLGLPRELPALGPDVETRLSTDLQWLPRKPFSQRLRYRLDAWLDYRLDPALDPVWRRRALELPPGNPQALELAANWRHDANGAVRSALDLFRQQAFHYTLSPLPLGEEAIDDFLFGTRRGFCEHYASAFVFLMRAASVPARVVTGYQGGEFNALGKYWIVRGRDAHAWAEVWLAGRGWVQVDPTAAVAPTRVSQGLDADLPAGERPSRMTFAAAWLQPLHLGWDLVNQRWNQWVLGYDFDRQHAFLNRLNPSLASLQGMVWALGLTGGLLLAGLSAWLFLGHRRQTDPVHRAWLRFCTRLQRIGLVYAADEAPETFARRAAAARPDLAAEIGRIAELYLDLRYGRAPTSQLRNLHRAVQDFRPPRHEHGVG